VKNEEGSEKKICVVQKNKVISTEYNKKHHEYKKTAIRSKLHGLYSD